MTIKGETVATGADPTTPCNICGGVYSIGVAMSGGGYYVGYTCQKCGSPFSRESEYCPTREKAADAFLYKRYCRR